MILMGCSLGPRVGRYICKVHRLHSAHDTIITSIQDPDFSVQARIKPGQLQPDEVVNSAVKAGRGLSVEFTSSYARDVRLDCG